MRIWLLTLTAIALLSGIVLVVLTTSTTATLALHTTSGNCAPINPQTSDTTAAGLTSEQAGNAVVIIQVGQQLDIPAYGQQIAVATSMQESGLRNLNHGDRDSLGLFQQRPSQGWGTTEQIRLFWSMCGCGWGVLGGGRRGRAGRGRSGRGGV